MQINKDRYSAVIFYSNEFVFTESCGANEEFTECGSACAGTCQTLEDLSSGVLGCIAACVKGCFCREGYIRNEETGECVLTKDCPGPGPGMKGYKLL